MGEHICDGSSSAVEGRVLASSDDRSALMLTRFLATPPMPAPSLFERFNPWGTSSASAEKQQPRAPPQLDTSAASTLDASRAKEALADNGPDRSYTAQGQLTPESLSSGSQPSDQSLSPKTPSGRPGADKRDDDFGPHIANNSPPTQQPRRVGGYGGLGDGNANGEEDQKLGANPPRKTSNLMDRMNNIAPGPFDSGRRPSGSLRSDIPERPGTSASNISTLSTGQNARMPRKNGYGGFGPPTRSPGGGMDDPPLTPSRADTFPRMNDGFPAPMRTPSAPLNATSLRPDSRMRLPSDAEESQRLSVMSTQSARRPSRGPDTSRPPPPRSASFQPKTPGLPTINLAEEFGIGNPYHTPSDSIASSSISERSAQSERRPSQASSRTSPPRSVASRSSGWNASDTSSLDSMATDLQPSLIDRKPKAGMPLSPLKPPPSALRDRPAERGYDPRIDPAVQNPRLGKGMSPTPSPTVANDPRDDPAIQDPRATPSVSSTPAPKPKSPPRAKPAALDFGDVPAMLRPGNANGGAPSPLSPALPSPRWNGSAEQDDELLFTRPREAPMPSPDMIPFSPVSPVDNPISRDPRQGLRKSPPRNSPPRTARDPRDNMRPGHERSQSRPQNMPSSRGDCKACGLPITGKSISSADGRLTGRYHKSCFVCFTCKEPFTSATFYVLDDRPYCEQHYHKLNGSLCGSCGNGIEGQYLEDETSKKHHVGCFRCGDCGMALKDGYFEVNGRAFCEKDAWRRVQQPWVGNGNRGPPRPGGPGGGYGLPGGPRAGGPNGFPGQFGPHGGSRLGPGSKPRMEKRMTRLGML
ncbi:hypothetical protein QBC38DRAFT_368947 [Podospora fimiseda]|uniref:LIM zinc-binding domain-containing protein n=1 Tax=Podospora fimiseda TaxID=252190 RepID=A0AAN7BL84_9PEZI|nr:hypothetical protein QBC38DRAFT_368947 [Podospora fimiseda]